MLKRNVEGTAEITEEQFTFSGGYNPDAQVIPNEIKMRGTLHVAKNVDVTFKKDATGIAAPPVMKTVLKTATVSVKRSNRNYVISCKYPIVQSNEDTQAMIKDDNEKIVKAIEEDRKTVQEIMN